MRSAGQLVTLSLLSSLLYMAECAGKDLYELETDYNKNIPPPGGKTEVSVSLFIIRVSAVDENKEEISLDVFLYVHWKDKRIRITEGHLEYVDITWVERENFWIPDLYIRQLREMKVLSLFQDISSVRLYRNQTMRISIGATVIIKCDMDFVLYPLDVQKCSVDFSSYKYTIADMIFKWRGDPLTFPSDFGGNGGYRLPKYVVSFSTVEGQQHIYYGEGNHSTARMYITMSREIRSYLLESYLPSTLFVIISWGSFIVVPDMVPGRMVLLVTVLLSLVTMFDTVRNNSPNALQLKCIEVWLISCTIFVFVALMEYFVVLFGIRYDKHWRHKKKEADRPNATPSGMTPGMLTPGMMTPGLMTPGMMTPEVGTTPNLTRAADSLNHQTRPIQHMSQLPPLLHHRHPSSSNSRVDNLRMFGTSKVGPQGASEEPKNDVSLFPPKIRPPVIIEPHMSPGEGRRTSQHPRRKFKMAAEYVVLFAGNSRGLIDQVSLVVFPVCFVLFTTAYWAFYISESRSRSND